MKKQEIDWPGFTAAVAVILAACVPLVLYPETGSVLLAGIYSEIAAHLGFLYLVSGVAVLVFLLWLALGPYGGSGSRLEMKNPSSVRPVGRRCCFVPVWVPA